MDCIRSNHSNRTTGMESSINIREKNGIRQLYFDASTSLQGAMRVTHPWDLELEYTRTMMAGLLLRDENYFPRNVLLIGLGAASLTKFLYRHYPLARLTVVEIEPAIADAASKYFGLPDDPARIDIVIGDGAGYVMTTDRKYDWILVDGFNEHAHPGCLNEPRFYEACRARLAERGLLTVNLIGLCPGVKGGFAYIENAFEHRALMFPVCKSGNTIAFAAAGELVSIPFGELKQRALALRARTGLDLLHTITRLEEGCQSGSLHF